MIEKFKKQFEDELRGTGRENIEHLISFLDRNGFYDAQCGHHDRFPGGTMVHSIRTLEIARKIYDSVLPSDQTLSRRIHQDSLTLCCLLHDVCDMRSLPEVARGHHGLRSKELIKLSGIYLYRQECAAICCHMHAPKDRIEKFKHSPNYTLRYPQWTLRSLVYDADKEAARNPYKI